MKWYKICNRISILLQAIWSVILYFIMEAICRHSISEAWTYMTGSPLVFGYNAALIFTSFLLVYLVHKRCFLRVLISLIWLILAIVNGILLTVRVTPFTGPDLKMIQDAMKVLKKYLPMAGVAAVLIGFGILVILMVIYLIKSPRYDGKVRYQISIPLVIVGFAAFALLTKTALEKRVLSNYFGNIAFAYEDYGYPYCLAVTFFDTGISCPQDYSEEEIERIEETESSLPETEESDSYPNIIFVQLESFLDPDLVNYLELSEDPIPFFHSLMENYSSGYYKVPAVGAGTCNTEFESITGMSLHYFGPGEYPYKSILKEKTCESAPYVLKGLGYSTHAIHNNEANFYGRKNIFPNLGFDTFTSEEYMAEEDNQNETGWVKDIVLTDEIMKCLESTPDQPDYVYTISVQGHGAYPDYQVLEDPEITVSGCNSEEQTYQWEYYVNQIHEMDNFIKDLVETLSDYPEDVVLVLYGDHIPTMGLTVEDMENRYLFQTEYVIWDNMGLEKEDENLAAYQMAAEVMDRVGIHEGNIFRYHQARRNTKDYQVDFETIQYDLLYGEGYSYGSGGSPYKKTDMRLGIYDVTLDSLVRVDEAQSTYLIRGSNYTPSCQVKINGKWYDTLFVNTTTLMISGQELDDFDKLSVCVRSNSSTKKSLSKSNDRAVYAIDADSKWVINQN